MGDRREAFAARREQMGYTQESFGAAVGWSSPPLDAGNGAS